MIVYVELAFLENFCLDFLLLSLSAYAARCAPRLLRLFLSAIVGGIFALLFPLLSLPPFLGGVLKCSVGALLPLLALGKRKWKTGTAFFLLFTFAFGGALTALQGLPAWGRFPVMIFLAAFSLFLVERLYARRALFAYLYDCEVVLQGKRATARGFLDSGNFATKSGIPVCFLSVDLLYDLMGEKWAFGSEEGGQGCDEMQIFTQAGVRTTPLYLGEIQIKRGKTVCEREVYFAPSTNRIGREYKILLNSRIFEGE